VNGSGQDSVFEVTLDISAAELQRLYRGEARVVVARTQDGQVVRFPAMALRPFVSHDGVRGRFRVRCDEARRLRGIERLGLI
jgi:hypothetical protein